ncbi:hypothetical protein K438DRAFT_1992770 [Mycena galopus ATCC 62051]|nr:hypothetical protein K438DRAFT_1992770 [Mycena galopus ATCC 62051]
MLRVLESLAALIVQLCDLAFPHYTLPFGRRDLANAYHENTECELYHWYISSWGLISRDGKLLSHLREPSHDPSDDPVYYAHSFQEAIDYLPLCRGFEGAFARNNGCLYPNTPVYYAIDGDSVIYSNRFSAEHAWIKQQDLLANVLATLSPFTALDRAALCVKKFSITKSCIIASS